MKRSRHKPPKKPITKASKNQKKRSDLWQKIKVWLIILIFSGTLCYFGIMVLLGLPINSPNTASHHEARGIARILGVVPISIGLLLLWAAIPFSPRR